VTSPRPLVVGHRGASGYRPEHTRASYELAFALGADAVEPDIVATRDGVLVLRHENDISRTTDVARHPEFAGRRTTKSVDGVNVTGWFTEDFTWAELSTLRAIERLPGVRQHSASFDGRYPILRLGELLELIDAASERHGRELGLVAEVKHATHFAQLGIPLGELIAEALSGWAGDGDRLVVESFEQSVLGDIKARGVSGRYVYLLEAKGAAADLVAGLGENAPSYSAQLSDTGLARLGTEVNGISVGKGRLIQIDGGGASTTDLIDRAHREGLAVFAWTLRPENKYLSVPFRRGRAAEWGDWRGEFRMLLDAGLDGAFFDHPDLGVAVRDER
jgi:glycerophosphoryl diester phosphodiesterase